MNKLKNSTEGQIRTTKSQKIQKRLNLTVLASKKASR